MANGATGLKTILEKVNASIDANPGKPKEVEKKIVPGSDPAVKKPTPEVLGNGGEWTMGMPEDI